MIPHQTYVRGNRGNAKLVLEPLGCLTIQIHLEVMDDYNWAAWAENSYRTNGFASLSLRGRVIHKNYVEVIQRECLHNRSNLAADDFEIEPRVSLCLAA